VFSEINMLRGVSKHMWLLEEEDRQRIFVITDFHRPHPVPMTTRAAPNRPGC